MIITLDYLDQIDNGKGIFYIVTRGYVVGIFGNDKLARQSYEGFSGAEHCSVKGKRKAIETLTDGLKMRSYFEQLNEDELETLNSCIKLLPELDKEIFPSII